MNQIYVVVLQVVNVHYIVGNASPFSEAILFVFRLGDACILAGVD